MDLRRTVAVLVAAGIPSLLAAQEKAKPSPVPVAPPAVAASAADPGTVERISLADLKKLMEANKVLVVDVRSADAYRTSHIPGSISAPLAEIDKHVAELKSAKQPIVTYCS